MKKIIILLVFLSYLSLYSQAIITGKITLNKGQYEDDEDEYGYEDDDLIVLKGFNYNKKTPIISEAFQDTISNLKTNHFTLTARVNTRRFIPVYLEKDSLYIRISNKKIIFKGRKSIVKINDFLQEKNALYFKILGNANKFFTLEEDEFLKAIKKYKKEVKKLIRKSKLPKKYSKFQKREANYFRVRSIENYEKYHQILINDDQFKVSSDFPKDAINEIDLNLEQDYKNSLDYRALIHEYLTKKSRINDNFDNDYLDIIDQKIKNDFIKNDLLFKFVKERISYVDHLDVFYNKYLKYSTNKVNQQEIKELFQEYENISKGKISPKFYDYKTTDGKKVSLDDLLNKDKKLYITVWATWCAFSKREIPVLQLYYDEYKNSGVEFVMICMGEESDLEWKKMVTQTELEGVQLFSGKDLKNTIFGKKYKIEGLPTFILLDENGKIISRNAPRPSSGKKLYDFFEENGIVK